jgi:hypothetical protein
MHLWVEQNWASPAWVSDPTVSVGGAIAAPPLGAELVDVVGGAGAGGFGLGAGLGFGFGRALGLRFGRGFAGAAVAVARVTIDLEGVLDDVELPPQPARPRAPRRAMVVAACRQRDMAPTVATTRLARSLGLE